MRQENQEVFISAQALRESTPEEIRALIAEAQQKLLDLKTQAQYRPPYDNSHLFKGYRRLIARAKTILREMG